MGEGTAFAKWIDSWRTDPATVLAQNTNMTNAFEQAASDRMLFHSSGEVRPTFELRTPEYVFFFLSLSFLEEEEGEEGANTHDLQSSPSVIVLKFHDKEGPHDAV